MKQTLVPLFLCWALIASAAAVCVLAIVAASDFGGPFDHVQIGQGAVGSSAQLLAFNPGWWLYTLTAFGSACFIYALLGCAFFPRIFPKRWREAILKDLSQ